MAWPIHFVKPLKLTRRANDEIQLANPPRFVWRHRAPIAEL